MKSPSKNNNYTIKINVPKSDIKVHKLYINDTQKISPDLKIRQTSQNQDDDIDKITQAWNRLEITALSKAIAIAPDVGPCTIGPNAAPVTEEDVNADVVDRETPDLGNAVTSTPFKMKKPFTKSAETSANTNKNSSFDISEIKPSENRSFAMDDIEDLQYLSKKCLISIEAQVQQQGERIKVERLKMWRENDIKIKEKLNALKMEMDKEQLLRIQEQYIEAQKVIMETKASAQVKAQQLEQSKSEHEQRIAETGEKLKLIEEKRRNLEEQHKLKRQELKRCVDGLYELQIEYKQKYNHISETTKKCKDMQKLNERVSGEIIMLKEMNSQLFGLIEKLNEGKVSVKDVKTAERLVEQITIISVTFSRHTADINASLEIAEEYKKKEHQEREQQAKQQQAREQKEREQQEREKQDRDLRAKQEEAERYQKTQEAQIATEENANKEPKTTKLLGGLGDCISRESLKWYLELGKYLEDYERKLQPLLVDDSLKKFRFECQKVVNVPVNAISPLDDLHLEDKLYKLSRLLQGLPVPLSNSMFLVTGHPLGVSYCTNMLAKKFVKQGELSVSSKPEAAFAIATVIVALWVDFPDFGRLLLAHFHRECPYLIPAFMPQVEGQSNEDYYKKLGYQYSEDGKVESQDKFLRRMSGVMRLYAAIFVTPLKRSQQSEGKRHPHNMRDAWRWFAATLNLCPRLDISPTLIFDFLEVTSWLFYRVYGAQFTKLLQLLCADYFPIIEQITPDGCGGPVTRLKSFLDKILKEGQVAPPAGLLPPNFW